MRDRRCEIVAFVVCVQLIFGECPEQHRALALQHTRMQQLIEQALDAIRMLGNVFEKKDATFDVRQIRRSREMRDERQIAAPEHAIGDDLRRPLERAFDFPRRVVENAEALLERERRRLRRSEIVRGHRSRKRDHSAPRKRRQLECGEIRMAKPACRLARHRRVIDPVE